MMTEELDALAPDYHWLFSDEGLSGEPFMDKVRDILSEVLAGTRILDCACQLGMHVFALARAGYDAYGTDTSAVMIQEARELAEKKGIDVPLEVSLWQDLPSLFAEKFSVAFCYGNAIGRCDSRDEMVASLRGIRGVLESGGLLAVDSVNWEVLHAAKPRFAVGAPCVRDGERCIPCSLWTIPDEWDEPHVLETMFLLDEGSRVHHRVHPVTYRAFRYNDLVERLEESGYGEIESNWTPECGAYRVLARMS